MKLQEEDIEGIKRLMAENGMDISLFSREFLERKINSRMLATGTSSAREYLRYLQSNSEEMTGFMESLSVRVSEFFRDADVWSEIDVIIQEIFKENKKDGYSVFRGWSAGCSTGEEAYSLAILAHRISIMMGLKAEISVWGTDIDSGAIDMAKSGRYPRERLMNVPHEILSEYFIPSEDSYIVKDNIKKMTRFIMRDITKFPVPNMDIVLCRNVVIFLEQDAKRTIFEKAAACARPGGYVITGKTEMIADPEGIGLEPINPRKKIYRKKER